MSGAVGSQRRLIRVVFIVTRNMWSQWSTYSFIAHWSNKCGAMQLISCGHSLPRKVGNIFQ